MPDDRARRAEASMIEMCGRRSGGAGPDAGLKAEIRGAAIVAAAVGVSVDRLAEITGAAPEDVRSWIADYRKRADGGFTSEGPW